LAPRARLLLSSFSLLAAAHVIRHTVAITAITTATIRATTRAITATGGVATIGLGGAIGITAGIMAGGAGTAGAAEVGGMAADGAGMVTIDLKKQPANLLGHPQAAREAAYGGGLPIKVGGAIVGATGVSGGTVRNDVDRVQAALGVVK
jgi:hypothetical protein